MCHLAPHLDTGYRGSGSGLHVCQANALPTELGLGLSCAFCNRCTQGLDWAAPSSCLTCPWVDSFWPVALSNPGLAPPVHSLPLLFLLDCSWSVLMLRLHPTIWWGLYLHSGGGSSREKCGMPGMGVASLASSRVMDKPLLPILMHSRSGMNIFPAGTHRNLCKDLLGVVVSY